MTPRGLLERGHLGLDRMHPVATDGQHALRVDQDEVPDTGRQQYLRAGDTGGAGAGDDHPQVDHHPLDDGRGIHQGGKYHDRGTVLVVVHHRDVQRLDQSLFHLEAPRRRDVLEIDRTEGRRDRGDGGHDLVGVGGAEHDRHGVQPGERLHQGGFALHHGQRGLRSDVAEAQHRGPIRDDGDHPGRPGVVPGGGRIDRDQAGDTGHAGGVQHREVAPVDQRCA